MLESIGREDAGLEAAGVDGSYSLPLTHEQSRLWFLAQTDPEHAAYHMGYRLLLAGRLDDGALARAVDRLVERHEALRTRYVEVDGEPRQLVRPRREQRIERVDLAALTPDERQRALRRTEADVVRHPFDLATGDLLRLRLVRLGREEHCLFAVMHHIIGDGWSHAVLVRDLCAFYNAEVNGCAEAPPAPLAIQYGDYALWQQRYAKTPECAANVRYWVEELRVAGDPLRLPRDYDAAAPADQGATVTFALPEELRGPLAAAMDSRRWLASAVLLAAYEAALARFADQDRFPIGLVTANRPNPQTADLIGFFVNTLAMPSDTADAATLRELVDRVQRRLVDGQPRHAAPFALVAAGAGASGTWGQHPLVRALFVLQNAPQPRFAAAGVSVTVERVHTGTSKFELSLIATEHHGSYAFELEYDARLFARGSVEAFRDLFLDLLGACLLCDDVPGNRLGPGTRTRPSVSRGRRRPELAAVPVPTLVAAQAAATPARIAIECGARTLTYADLQHSVTAYANVLAAHGIAREDVVAIVLPRSAELVVAMLGVMAAGAAYLPLSAELPPEHVRRAIRRVGARAIVGGVAGTDSGEGAPDGDGVDGLIRLPLPAPLTARPERTPASEDAQLPTPTPQLPTSNSQLPSTAPSSWKLEVGSWELTPSDLAYVIHTSGSTGEPKFVLVEHAGLANVTRWIGETLALTPDDRCLLKTPVSFDASARELYPMLTSGGTLVIAAAEAHRDMEVLHQNLSAARATILHCVPSQLEGLMAHGGLPSLRAVMCGGERLPATTAARFRARERARLWNVYGPTEATVDATAFPVDRDIATGIVPIGTPIPNMTVTIVDATGRPAPLGAVGEIHLSGVGVARGYLSRSREQGAGCSESAFRLDEATGERRYATGDRGRMAADGTVEFLRRADRQVKRHGVRIELAAIERAALDHPAVGSAHVVLVDGNGTTTRLVAFVAPRDRGDRTTADEERTSAEWQAVFETTYERMPAGTDARVNTHGWVESAHRQPIAPAEVLSAADEAAARILRWRPARILDLGCGTGLLLARLAPHCRAYHGVDFARAALDAAERYTRTEALTHVRLTHADMTSFEPGHADEYDAIVLNSVVQYFAGPEIVVWRLRRLARSLAPGGFFFVGDVRDSRLADAASLQRVLARLSPLPAAAALTAARLERARDDELCLDPAFFRAWQETAGGDFAPPMVEAKTSLGANELVKYRFDVTLARRAAVSAPVVSRNAGRFRHRLAWPELEAARRAAAEHRRTPLYPTGVQPNGRVGNERPPQSAAPSPVGLDRAGDLRLPADVCRALAAEAAAGTHVICRVDEEPGCFDAIEIAGAASAGDAAAAAAYLGREPSRAVAPGRFRRFLRDTNDLAGWLRDRLPSYVVPDRLVHLPEMPLTAHGKTDLALLQVAAESDALAAATSPDDEKPQDAIEAEICRAFSDVTGVPFARDDDFFLNGGHSLLATRARARLSRSLGIDVPLRAIFDAPAPRLLASTVRTLLSAAAAPPPAAIPRRANRTAATPSPAQRRLWFIERLGTASPVYNVAHAMRVEGALDLDALDCAVGDLVERHAPLRSRFPGHDGHPTVAIDPPRARGNLEVLAGGQRVSIEAATAAFQAAATQRFDLERDRLLRVLVSPVAVEAGAPPAHVLGLVAHHIVADGWSMAIALSELATFYAARARGDRAALEPLAVDYYDVAAWQQAAATRGALEEHITHSLDELRGAPSRLVLPYDHPAPARRTWSGAKVAFDVPEAVTSGLRTLAAASRATSFMVLLAAFEVLLHKMSGASDFVVGTVIANRHRSELEPLVGFLVNPLALRATIAPDDTFNDLLQRVRGRSLAAFEHQEAPFEAVLERLAVDRRTDYQAVFQVLFALQNAGDGHAAFGGLRCERIRLPPPGAMFDLGLELKETGATLHAELEFSTDLFRHETARLVCDRYLRLLDEVSRAPHARIDELTIAAPREEASVLRFGRGPRSRVERLDTMPHRLRSHALTSPAQPAIEDGSRTATYAELLSAVAATAARLRTAGVRRGDLVGIHLPRGLDAAVASFGAQFVGAAPVYIDPNLPAARRDEIGRAARARVCIAREGEAAPGAAAAVAVAPVERASGALDPGDPSLVPDTRPDDIAFATFTSGSSGVPKAVLVSQRAIGLRLQANDSVLAPLAHGDRVAHAYSFNYDGGLVTLFWPLWRGATVAFLPLDLLGDADRLARALARERITVFDAIPAVLRDLFASPRGGMPALRLVVTGGDVCPPELPGLVLDSADVLFANQYGPCEAVVNATTWTADRRTRARRPTIGRPIPDADIFIVDPSDRLCPIGVPGEILIGGPALAEGYLDAPELTAAKFVALAAAGGARVYRSGDVGRWTVDGEIEILGRVDRQVQVRGMRTDPREIETALGACPGVAGCHVDPAGAGDVAGFTAYVVPASDDAAAATASALERERLDEWRSAFDGLFSPAHAADPGEPDYSGWDDTATGTPIPRDEMDRWRAATLDRLRARPFRRVLEVGAGLGLIALPLAPDAECYVATDASPVAVERLADAARQLGITTLSARCLGADAIDGIEELFDLVILNSVVQYFPSACFLRRTLRACARLLAPGGRIFVGDVRDARLAGLLHLEVAAARCGPAAAATRVRRLAAESARQHEELQVAPAFFADVPDERGSTFAALPLLKIDAGRSEMARYRYDVWLTPPSRLALRRDTAPSRLPLRRDTALSRLALRRDTAPSHLALWRDNAVASPRPERVVTWSVGSDWRGELETAMRSSPGARVRLSAARNQRLVPALAVEARMRDEASEGHTLHPRHAARTEPGIEPDRLLTLAGAHGRTLLATPAATGDPTCFDAWFLPPGDGGPSSATAVLPPEATLATDPLFGRRAARLRVAIAQHAADRLPSHMRPRRYVFLPRLPVRPGAKIDLAALRALDPGDPEPARGTQAIDVPLAVMADLWRTLVGADEVGPESDFFALGGHSLLAARLVAAVRREFGVELPVMRVFELRTLAAITREVADLRTARRTNARAAVPWSDRRATAEARWTRVQRSILARLASLPAGRDRHLGLSVGVEGAVDRAALSRTAGALVELHPMLGRRLRSDGVATASGVPLTVGSVAGPDDGREAARWPLDLEADGPFTIATADRARGATLVVRAHPAFFDADSLRIVLADLAAAYQAIVEGRAPLDGRVPTDYAALSALEDARPAANDAAPPLRPASPGRRHDGTQPVSEMATWTSREATMLDAVAVRLGTTPCAVLLGGFAMAVGRLATDVRIECPVSTRAMLDAEGVIGPFAVDAAVAFGRNELATLPDAAAAAATRIAALLDATPDAGRAQAGTAPAFAFTYQERTAALAVPGTRVPADPVVHAAPFWVDLKLAVRRRGAELDLRLTRDPAVFSAAVTEAVLANLRQTLLAWDGR